MQRRLKIMLTEGTSLSARQTIYALAPLHPVIDVCDSKPLVSMARSSIHVRTCFRCPPFGKDPAGYLRYLRQRLRSSRYDVLLPVHDQVFLLSRFRERLGELAGLAVPEFDAIQQLQSKASLVRLLAAMGLPFPPTVIGQTRRELQELPTPCFIKLAYSTAGCGVWHVGDEREAAQTFDRLEREGALDGRRELLVQQPAPGTLCVVQSVFQHGRLVAAHCYRARALGLGGSARSRISVAHPLVIEHLRRLGGHLNWHGALMLDYIFNDETQQPAYIDANPRIGETVNALLSGVNLCAALVRVSLGETVAGLALGHSGVQTHSLLTSLLAAAEQGANRRQLLAEMGRAWRPTGVYSDSQDELTRPGEDPLSVLPALVVAMQLLMNPGAAGRIVRGAVANYSLSDETVQAIAQI